MPVLDLKNNKEDLDIEINFTKPEASMPSVRDTLSLIVQNNKESSQKNIEDNIENIQSSNTNNLKSPAPTKEKQTEKLYGSSNTTLSISAPIDLAVKITDLGILDKNTNIFTPTQTFSSTDRIAVRFVVENVGGTQSPSWYFNAVLPTNPNHIFQSEYQKALAPRDKIEFTLGFDSIEKTDGNIFTVNIDPAELIAEKTKVNNIIQLTINGVRF